MAVSPTSPNPSTPSPSPAAPRPMVRPGARPVAKPPKSASSKGPVIGLVIFAVLAVTGLGAAGFLYMQQGSLKAEIDVHRKAALEAARAANIAVDTNAAVDWATIWPRINTTFSTLRGESDRQSVRLREMEQELEVAAGLQANLQTAQANAQRSAQQLSEANAQLESVRAESAQRIAALETRLAAAQKAAEEAQAAAAAVAQAKPVDDIGEAAPVAAPVAADEATPEPADDAGEIAGVNVPARIEIGALHSFPERRSDLLAAAGYDANAGAMTIRLHNGTSIVYPDFPRELYEQLVTTPTFETFYRIKIMGQFPSIPDDKTAVRASRRR